MITSGSLRTLVADVHRIGRRRDIGTQRRPTIDDGTHFVALVKPEVMQIGSAADAMAEVARVLGEADVTALRYALIPAREYGELGFLMQHYPRLHRIAVDGARGLCTYAHREFTSLLDQSEADIAVGAFQAGAYELALTAEMLEARCRQAGIHKLGSGSYASVVDLNGCPVVVLNGFVPALASSYGSDRTSLVGLVECHSYREIADLRAHVLGALNPSAAPPTSLRGALGRLVDRQYGITLSEGRNGVHLSAGHLEGMFQVWRYFAAADGLGLECTVLGRALANRRIRMAAVAEMAADHNFSEGSGRNVSPHGATENLNREAVIDCVVRWTDESRGSHA
ncbi:hypothetical protein [Nocardia goodfellowii]|uniref:Uncharacterized protein n=1 Tax=Nocardia goodfellowii TaxID=882446 RepID=A0ABS4QDD3_9NOCA|nr:hypothetical protein [Nocardia goodfellowii]MBP2189672.1 hypothetical protein [Nocardia goodfellowii]